MKNIRFLLITLLFFALACENEGETVSAASEVTIHATLDGQSFASGSQIGVYLDYANGNIPFVSGNSGSFTGSMPTASAGTLYAYSPYNQALGRSPKQVHFNLETLQASASSGQNNSFAIANAVGVDHLKSPVSLEFLPATVAVDFAITVPAGGPARRIESVTLRCDAQKFYTQALADLTENKISYAARGAINSKAHITWSNSAAGTINPGGNIDARVVLFPDDYSIFPFEVIVVTDQGNYAFEWALGRTLARGEQIDYGYTLSESDWYDPEMIVVSSTALDAPDLVSTPVQVDLSLLQTLGLTPATILFSPEAPAEEVSYVVTADDITAGSAVVAKGAGEKYLQPETAYTIRLFDAANTQIAISSATTKPGMDITTLAVATAQDPHTPVSTPVEVDFTKLTAIKLAPATILFTPEVATNAVTYSVTGADLAASKAVVLKGSSGDYLQPATQYSISVYGATGNLMATTSVTTKAAMDLTDVTVATPGTDIRTVIEGVSRQVKVYLPPGDYTNTSAGNWLITKDLILFGSDPATTIVTSTVNLIPRGTIGKIEVCGVTWKSTANQLFRPHTDATSGTTHIASLKIHDLVADFSANTGGGTLFYGRARFSEGGSSYVKLDEMVVDNIIYVGSGSAGSSDYYAIYTVGGSDFLMKQGKITVTNSTFANLYNGLIYLPAGSADYPMPATNDGINPTLTLKNNTLYRVGCGTASGSTTALIFLGTGAYSFPSASVAYNNNVLVAGPNNNHLNLVNCADVNIATTKAKFDPLFINNWGLSGQSWRFRNSESNLPTTGKSTFSGTAAAFFRNPLDSPLTSGASYQVVGADVKGAGDPRWY